ncbi:hypothetical protein WMY93_002847 [Mugilogobius chulae]|uniref:Uncharacterized protein n=1 Tax=Mugilogobius chulae TaxID=88201 RepID=A0AAW0PUW9_9GOBI
MTASTEEAFSTKNEQVLEQIRLLRHDLDETTRKVDDVRKRTNKAREELMEYTKETKQQISLMMQNIQVFDVLFELGQLLEKEHTLQEELKCQSEKDRHIWKELQHRNETITNKVQCLTCEIAGVTHQLNETMAHFQTEKSEHNSKARRSQAERT